MKTEPARLDADGTAVPKTKIIHHPNPDNCMSPGMPLHNPELQLENGERILLTAKPVYKKDPWVYRHIVVVEVSSPEEAKRLRDSLRKELPGYADGTVAMTEKCYPDRDEVDDDWEL